jgi:ABC-2 type transport system permease protein
MIASKFVAVTLLSIVFAVAMLVLAGAITVIWYKTADASLALGDGELWLTIFGNAAVLVLFGLLGLGIGALVRNQVGAIVGSLVYLFVLENLLQIIPGVDDVLSKYGIGGVSSGLSGADEPSDLLGQLPAGLLFAGYCAIFIVVGIELMRRRDITA